MTKIRAAIVGYGNLGKSVEKLIAKEPDMELVGIFSRRDTLDTATPVFTIDTSAVGLPIRVLSSGVVPYHVFPRGPLGISVANPSG